MFYPVHYVGGERACCWGSELRVKPESRAQSTRGVLRARLRHKQPISSISIAGSDVDIRDKGSLHNYVTLEGGWVL